MASSREPYREQGREEDDDDEIRNCQLIKEGTALEPEEPEQVLPLSLEEAPPPAPVEAAPAPEITAEEANWSVNLFREAFNMLRQVVIHLGVPGPNDPLQRTIKVFAFKIHILAGDLERGVLDPVDDDGGDDGGFDDSDDGDLDCFSSDSDVGLLQRRVPLLN
jgi:hypothetical protein